jgi:hypothetical protein
MAGSILTEARRGKNIRHMVEGLFRLSVFGRLAGYEDVNDADRLSLDPAMRTIVDSRGLMRNASILGVARRGSAQVRFHVSGKCASEWY